MIAPPLAMLAEITHRCPMRCVYCSNPLALEPARAELPTATWCRVLDEAAGHVINVGSGQAYTITAVAELLAQAMGLDIAPEITGRYRAGDIRNCFADISKARELLAFSPAHRLEDTLDELATWVAGQEAVDRSAEMKQHLEARGLVT